MDIVPKNGKFCLQSLDLWNFITIFYVRNTFLRYWSKIEEWDIIFHSCDKFYIFYPCFVVLQLGKDIIPLTLRIISYV
jgi:hypothetical protein